MDLGVRRALSHMRGYSGRILVRMGQTYALDHVSRYTI